jgi:putative ABC transport system permease protein
MLTMLSITVAFVLFGSLHGVSAAIDGIIAQMSDTRLRIQSRVNITEPLPLAQLARIENVPGVTAVGYYNFLAAYYQEPANSVNAGAVDIERFTAVFGDVAISPEHVEAMKRTRSGALIGESLAAERGWQIGDRVPLKSGVWTRKDGTSEWPVEIVGTYRWADNKVPSNELWMNYAYFDEARSLGNGTVTLYFARITDASQAGAIADSIDALFASSSNETQTMNERDWIRSRINQTGDIQFFINAIVGAVVFTLLFLTGNTMMQSVRERIPELAVLKTYGYGNGALAALIFAEALLLCGVAGALGLTIAKLLSPFVYEALDANGLAFPWSVIGAGLALAAVTALLTTLPPARRAQRLSIVDALAGR